MRYDWSDKPPTPKDEPMPTPASLSISLPENVVVALLRARGWTVDGGSLVTASGDRQAASSAHHDRLGWHWMLSEALAVALREEAQALTPPPADADPEANPEARGS